MKKINVILIVLISCFSIEYYAGTNEPNKLNDPVKSINSLIRESTSFIKKHILIIALTPIATYHHKDITNFITYHPYSSSLAFYLGLHYICDSISNFQEQKSLLEIILLLKKVTLYLVVCHGIKNHIHQKNFSFKPFVDEHDFLSSITANLPYDFNELSLICLKSYQELKLYLQSLNMQLTIESEEFVFLCHASSISLQSILYLVQNDVNLYQAIYEFEKKPEVHCQHLAEYLTSEITQNFINLEERLLTSNIQAELL